MSSHLVAIASAELALHLKISIPDDPKRVDAAARGGEGELSRSPEAATSAAGRSICI